MLDKRKELFFKSIPENIHLVEKFIDLISDEYNINNTYFGNILIAVTEAVTNAIEHGNKKDPQKNVFLKFDIRPKGFAFIVSDEGEGFDINKITDPTDVVHNTNSEEGRGIYLIRSLADEVNFSEKGTQIELIFNIASINAELALDRINQLNLYSKSSINSKINN